MCLTSFPVEYDNMGMVTKTVEFTVHYDKGRGYSLMIAPVSIDYRQGYVMRSVDVWQCKRFALLTCKRKSDKQEMKAMEIAKERISSGYYRETLQEMGLTI